MSEVSIRDLRNHGGDIVERARRGENLTITRSGTPVALLTGLDRPPVPLTEVRRRWEQLPSVDSDRLRADIDAHLDPAV